MVGCASRTDQPVMNTEPTLLSTQFILRKLNSIDPTHLISYHVSQQLWEDFVSSVRTITTVQDASGRLSEDVLSAISLMTITVDALVTSHFTKSARTERRGSTGSTLLRTVRRWPSRRRSHPSSRSDVRLKERADEILHLIATATDDYEMRHALVQQVDKLVDEMLAFLDDTTTDDSHFVDSENKQRLSHHGTCKGSARPIMQQADSLEPTVTRSEDLQKSGGTGKALMADIKDSLGSQSTQAGRRLMRSISSSLQSHASLTMFSRKTRISSKTQMNLAEKEQMAVDSLFSSGSAYSTPQGHDTVSRSQNRSKLKMLFGANTAATDQEQQQLSSSPQSRSASTVRTPSIKKLFRQSYPSSKSTGSSSKISSASSSLDSTLVESCMSIPEAIPEADGNKAALIGNSSPSEKQLTGYEDDFVPFPATSPERSVFAGLQRFNSRRLPGQKQVNLDDSQTSAPRSHDCSSRPYSGDFSLSRFGEPAQNEDDDYYSVDSDQESTTSSSYFSARSTYSFSEHSIHSIESSVRNPETNDLNLTSGNGQPDPDDTTRTLTSHHLVTAESKDLLQLGFQPSNATPAHGFPLQKQTDASYQSNGFSSILARHWRPGTLKHGRSRSRKPVWCAIRYSPDKTVTSEDTERKNEVQIQEHGKTVMVMRSFDDKPPHITAGTIPKLLDKLADETVQENDPEYVDACLLGHSLFVDSESLFDVLRGRFNDHSCNDAKDHRHHCSIQIRILSVISRWISIQYDEFRRNEQLLSLLHTFLDQELSSSVFQEERDMLKKALTDQATKEPFKSTGRSLADDLLSTTPSSNWLPRPPHISSHLFALRPSSFNASRTSISDTSAASVTVPVITSLHPKEVAEYLTLADFQLFKSITAYEYLNGYKRRKSEGVEDEAILSGSCVYTDILTKRANMISHWVLHEVTSAQKAKQRRSIIRRFIQIAKNCIEWNNFHTGMIITLGLQSPGVQRLQETWESLPNRELAAFQDLQKYLDVTNNMAFYRQALSNSKGPTIPFFPVLLKDLTFLLDGNPTTLPNQLINFNKIRSLARFFERSQHYVKDEYSFAADLQNYAFLPGAVTKSPKVRPLDGVAEAIENQINSVENCYDNGTQCETRLLKRHSV